ncbi:2Fe-2S iron-sulfur cluster-binding protein [uncultured Roseibium sp.]|uniref:2Fe-2S iron-sulfur cluster-binding protein n=1 Tax=uncultured Roseibium sp. TaxID=1936171 RepID=UPI0032180DAB
MKVTYVSPDGQKTEVDVEKGDNLMQAAVANNIEGIVGECGGSMMCATCHVYVAEPWIGSFPEKSEGEAEMLECATADLKAGSRLGCQITVDAGMDGLTVHVPDSQQ